MISISSTQWGLRILYLGENGIDINQCLEWYLGISRNISISASLVNLSFLFENFINIIYNYFFFTNK